MTLQYLYIALLFLAVGISIALAGYGLRNRSRPGLLYFAGMMLFVGGYVFTSGMMSISSTPEMALAWVNPHYFTLNMEVAFFISFVLHYSGRQKWLKPPVLVIFFSMPILIQIIIVTNPLHHLFIKEILFVRSGILMGLKNITYGNFFLFHSIYNYLLVLTAIGMLIQMSIRSFKLYRLQSLTLLAGVIIPLLASMNDSRLFMFNFEFPLVPLGFAMMGTAIFWNMVRNQMLDIAPVAREMLIDSML
ncbi:MAG: hypothetical protein JEZ06_18285, partial [Anaerolineaceae bacterium]|nr:hypothetical protein [Anaerolineaceae bacterium]